MKDILELLKKHGGKVHGPHVETVSIPLDNFSTLIRKAVEEERARLTSEESRYFPFEFEVWCDDEMVASASGLREEALIEAMNYAAKYEQDGPVRVFEVTRQLVEPSVQTITGVASVILSRNGSASSAKEVQ